MTSTAKGFAPALEHDGLEFGGQESISAAESAEHGCVAGEPLVLASFNIRYGAGPRLISSGLMRKIGINPPRHRPEAVQRNLTRAAQQLIGDALMPRPDILALQEADKRTVRAGGQHVAEVLARQTSMSFVHAAAGIPRGELPQKRQWWLNFEEQIGLHDPGDT